MNRWGTTTGGMVDQAARSTCLKKISRSTPGQSHNRHFFPKSISISQIGYIQITDPFMVYHLPSTSTNYGQSSSRHITQMLHVWHIYIYTVHINRLTNIYPKSGPVIETNSCGSVCANVEKLYMGYGHPAHNDDRQHDSYMNPNMDRGWLRNPAPVDQWPFQDPMDWRYRFHI